MRFFEHHTVASLVKSRMRGGKQRGSIDERYVLQTTINETSRRGICSHRETSEMVTLNSEYNWVVQGRPYFKVYPDMARAMSEVSVDLPSSSIMFPFNVFAIILADDDGNDFRDEGHSPVMSIMVSEAFFSDARDDGSFRVKMNRDGTMDLRGGDSRSLRVNFNLRGDDGEVASYDATYGLDSLKDIEDSFGDVWRSGVHQNSEPGEYVPSADLYLKVIRLAVVCTFFGTDRHELVLPDVKRKVIDRTMSRTGCSEIDAIKSEKDKAVRDGCKSWTIGKEISLPRPVYTGSGKDDTRGGAREISYGYVRRGFLRMQPCGEGRSQRRLVFVHPHVVRPDLPMSSKKGYRI